MEYTEILNFITSLPTWAWFVIGFILLILTGDRKLWEYEVKFPLQAGIGRGEVEFECLKKKGSTIEIKLQLEPDYNNKRIDIMLNGLVVYTISEHDNAGKSIVINKKVPLEKPNEGDEVIIKIGGEKVFTGQLVLD
jgi:hypothetical protein